MRRGLVLVGMSLIAIGSVIIAFSLIPFPFQTKEQYFVPQSSVLLNESFVVPVGTTSRTLSLNEGDTININFEVTSGGNLDVNFYFYDGNNYLVSLSRATNYNNDVTIPNSARWYFVWDNSFSVITQKGVTTSISKTWSEVAYRDVIEYHSVIPAEFTTTTEYLGISIILIGITIIGWGLVSKKQTPTN